MRWLTQRLTSLRSLAVIYGLAFLAACWEYSHVQHGRPEKNPLRRDLDSVQHLAEVSGKLYPRRESPHYYAGFWAFHQGDYATARKCFEQALAANDQDENLLYEYAETLVLLGESPEIVNEAVAAWRWNYPFSDAPDPRELKQDLADSPDYLHGLAALQKLDLPKARRHFERDLAAGSRTEQLLYNYALTLLLLDEDRGQIDLVVKQWKRDYPFSKQPDPRQAVERARQSQPSDKP